MQASGASSSSRRAPHIFIVVGEESGDQLGAALMRALRARAGADVRFGGVGGAAMAAEGFSGLFPLTDVSLMGINAVLKGLPRVVARIRQTAEAVIAARPDVLVIVDSPDFTHRVARRVRAAAPDIPIVDYVSPSVWAWRPRRAPAMRRYVDHVLALLPFEPAVHCRLGGPPCTYVGHPLVESAGLLRPNAEEARRREAAPPVLLVLPGSRRGEIRRLIGAFGGTVERVRAQAGPLELVLPTLPHLRGEVEAATAAWSVRPRIVVGAQAKQAAFRVARAALAASGTVTLELALAGVPMVVGYRVGRAEGVLGRLMIRVSSIVLANLVLEQNVVPQFVQGECAPEPLAAALAPLLIDSSERRRQTEAFARLDHIMEIGVAAPSARAADIVLAHLRNARD
ncbi:MAG: lipid-A-disaccharide synthase [Variibacter sp.]|nr:lipid-A-disaccharide synthase [Variibacter sp.]